MENQCRHKSFRQVSKIIPWSLQTPAALKEDQYKSLFKHKIFKHSPGVCSTSLIDPEPLCIGWLFAPFACSNLKAQLLLLNFEVQHKGSPYKAAGIAKGDGQENKKKNILWPEWDFPKLLINKVNKGLCNLLITKMEQPSSHCKSPHWCWLLMLFTANHIKAPLPHTPENKLWFTLLASVKSPVHYYTSTCPS